jgi:hypothetical protein
MKKKKWNLLLSSLDERFVFLYRYSKGEFENILLYILGLVLRGT